ncbi:MAG: orotate phosphoribosyltransferase [Nanoarchaeota archaeon]
MHEIAKLLIDAKAVMLRPKEPFTYASGIKSPIYTDCRLMISMPSARRMIVERWKANAQNKGIHLIAGTATAAIPWAAFLADAMNLPMCYVRKEEKGHGMGKRIEGIAEKRQHALLVEDLVTTGGSSLSAIKALREAGCAADTCFCIFSYGLAKSAAAFSEEGAELIPLCTLPELLEHSALSLEERRIVETWAKDPDRWKS